MIFTLGCFVIITGILASVGLFTVLAITNKIVYYNNLSVYWILLCAAICNVLAMIPHYILYAKCLDSLLLFSSILSVIASVILNFIMIKYCGIIGAAIAMLFVYLIMGGSKLIMVLIAKPKMITEFSSL